MNINPISNANFNGASIKNIKTAAYNNGDDAEQNVSLTVSSDDIMKINDNKITAKDCSFALKPEDVKGFYTAYCIAKQMPKGSTIDMELYKGVPTGYINLP